MKKHFIAAVDKFFSTSVKKSQIIDTKPVDVVLIGGGIMSATLGIYLKELEPNWSIHVYERLKKIAEESSNSWNNAGTGHAAFCELNYTTITKDGTIDISKAVSVNESFEISRQLWTYLVKQKILKEPRTFINNVPHISFVWGEKNIRFLRKRFYALQTSTLFRGMNYSEDPKQIHAWAPLIMDGRDTFQTIAATRMKMGTDVNFGEITQQLLIALQQKPNFYLYLEHDVINIKRNVDQTWNIYISDKTNNNQQKIVIARNIFIGCGGASLRLLQKSAIPESNGYAGFPVGGQFLVTTNPAIIKRHYAKVYGKTLINMPPMSVPHIDTRFLDGKKILLFGPFATFSSKFLKHGSWLDLFLSLNCHNLLPMIHAGLNNFSLIKYLTNQLLMSDIDRLNALKKYYPQANLTDWSLIKAGQRVQIIKKDDVKGGVLKFGTEMINSSDGSLAALLGASPGASVAASIMLELLKKMFKKQITSESWQNKLKEIIPSYGQTINHNSILTNDIRSYTCNVLGLTYIESKPLSE